jgi:hypothetical protein
MKEIASAKVQPPTGTGEPDAKPPDAKPRRRPVARERAAPVLHALPADGGLQLRQEAVPPERQEVTLEDDMKALDALLGI